MGETGPVIDFACLEAIAGLQAAGGEDLMKNVIQIYLSHSLGLMRKLDEAVAADDRKAIMETAHTLKSSSAQLGAGRLAALLQRIELMGRNGETALAPRTQLEVREEYEAARAVLEVYLQEKSR